MFIYLVPRKLPPLPMLPNWYWNCQQQLVMAATQSHHYFLQYFEVWYAWTHNVACDIHSVYSPNSIEFGFVPFRWPCDDLDTLAQSTFLPANWHRPVRDQVRLAHVDTDNWLPVQHFIRNKNYMQWKIVKTLTNRIEININLPFDMPNSRRSSNLANFWALTFLVFCWKLCSFTVKNSKCDHTTCRFSI